MSPIGRGDCCLVIRSPFDECVLSILGWLQTRLVMNPYEAPTPSVENAEPVDLLIYCLAFLLVGLYALIVIGPPLLLCEYFIRLGLEGNCSPRMSKWIFVIGVVILFGSKNLPGMFSGDTEGCLSVLWPMFAIATFWGAIQGFNALGVPTYSSGELYLKYSWAVAITQFYMVFGRGIKLWWEIQVDKLERAE